MTEASQQVAALAAEALPPADPTARARKLLLQRGWDLFTRRHGPATVRLACADGQVLVVLDTPHGQVLLGKAEGDEAVQMVHNLAAGLLVQAEGGDDGQG
jgi:hypothetical protein